VYYVIFGLVLKIDKGVDNFLLFLTIGLFIFQFTQKATIDGASSIVGNRGVIKAVRFPRAPPPISTTTELLATIPNLLVMVMIAVLAGTAPGPRWLALIPLTAVQLVFTMGAAMVAARMTTHFADTTQILPLVFRLILYGSGVIFSVDAYIEQGGYAQLLFILNLMYCFITLGRWSVLGGDFKGDLLISAIVWSIVMFCAGFLWFLAGEERSARD
jgi:teichoic acid transport system permease protein